MAKIPVSFTCSRCGEEISWDFNDVYKESMGGFSNSRTIFPSFNIVSYREKRLGVAEKNVYCIPCQKALKREKREKFLSLFKKLFDFFGER